MKFWLKFENFENLWYRSLAVAEADHIKLSQENKKTQKIIESLRQKQNEVEK